MVDRITGSTGWLRQDNRIYRMVARITDQRIPEICDIL